MKTNDRLVKLALASAILAALSPAVWAGAATPDAAHAKARATATAVVTAKVNASAPQSTQTPPPSQEQQQPSSNTKTLQTIVVTASATGVKKLDASYNIVTANRQEIQLVNPKSVANLLKISPGIWPESSGGQTGANIEIAGFPGGGDAPFFTVMINGTPLYGMPSLSFMDSSSLLRLDDTISRVEIVQGGPGVIYGPGQMGATMNFILRQGTATPTGDIGYTRGTQQGAGRLDGFYGFQIADGWFASIGGFYVSNDGVRKTGYTANKGGQLTATLSHSFSNGDFMLWARSLNIKNEYITPFALIQTSGTQFKGFPGFSPLTGTYYSPAIQYVQVPDPSGGLEGANLANGRGTQFNYFGGTYDATFGGWTVSDHFIFDGGDLPTNALFSGPNPKPLSYYLYGCNMAQPAGWCTNGTPADNDSLGYPTSRAVSATLPNGQAVPLDQSVIHQGWWYIQKRLRNFDNDFRLSREIFSGNTLTAGIYLARYTDHDNWSLGNQMLMLNQSNTKPIGVTYTNNKGQTVVVANKDGFVDFNDNFNILESGTGTNKAFYLSDAWRIGPWLFQAGGRIENIDVHQQTCNQKKVDLDNNPLTLYDNTTPICNGTWDREHYDKSKPSFTAGVNYDISDHMSAYVRYDTGGHFDDFDNGIRGANGDFAPVQKIENMEAGFKYGSPILFVNLDIYHRLFNGLKYQETGPNGQPLPGNIFSLYGSNSHGLDLSLTWSPITNLKLQLVGDYMDGHYSHHNACAPFTNLQGQQECISFNGKPLQRQPKIQYRFMPSYTLPTGWGNIVAYVRYQYVGQRYEDQSGLQPLGKYHTYAAGAVANVGDHWQLRLQGTNLTNQIGLTEGNSRVFGQETGVGGVIMARSIRGREVHFQVKYIF